MGGWVWVVAALAVAWALAYWNASLWIWTAAAALGLAAVSSLAGMGETAAALAWVIFVVVAAVLNVSPIRRAVITRPVFRWFRSALPQVSQTEQEALDAGTVAQAPVRAQARADRRGASVSRRTRQRVVRDAR
jgi:acyl-CoA dehydrogenase